MIMKNDRESNNICGKAVYKARREKNLTQEELASRLQVEGISISRDAVSRIESGSRFVADYELKALCHVLNKSPEWLLLEINTDHT